MKILITGGLGFIGANLVKYWLGKYKKDEVAVIDKCTYAANQTLLKQFKVFPNFTFYKGDISDMSFLEKIFKKEGFDLCVNLAAETSVDRSFTNPDLFYQSNVIGVINLAICCSKYSVKHFHQVSTGEVYGDISLDSNHVFKETDPFNPKNPYALSKVHGEEFLKMFKLNNALTYTISRVCNAYGPYQAYDKLIPLVIKRAKAEQEIPIYGTGTNTRDWIFVLDVCYAIDLIMHKGKDGEAYNVSVHEEYENIKLVRLILKKLRRSSKLIKFVDDRKNHEIRYNFDTTKIEKELGFRYQYDFEYAIDLTIDHYLDR